MTLTCDIEDESGITATDFFAGAGGGTNGLKRAGIRVEQAVNHWRTAVDVHEMRHPDTRHDCADLTEADPRRYQRTDILLAGPECTKHSNARGVSRKRQDPSLWDAPDPAAVRSRATMWTIPHFAEQMQYSAIIVENVWEATKWVGWRGWHAVMEDLGYEHKVLSLNSADFTVPQLRDRIYVVFWRKGIKIDLELEREAWCPRCERWQPCRQSWKNGRTSGRYGPQWVWGCLTCGGRAVPLHRPATDVLDMSLPCPLIGERDEPLADNTRARIAAGVARHWPDDIVTIGAGNGFERTPGNRARKLTEPLTTQTTTMQHALVVHLRGTSDQQIARSAQPTDRPVGTITAGGNHHALVMRNNTGGAEMLTPATEPVRTMTTKAHQSLILPYYSRSHAQPAGDRPLPTVTTKDRFAYVNPADVDVDRCGFRMLAPYEAAMFQAFERGYIPEDLPAKDQVKLAGNAMTAPVPQWIGERVRAALEAA